VAKIISGEKKNGGSINRVAAWRRNHGGVNGGMAWQREKMAATLWQGISGWHQRNGITTTSGVSAT